MGVYKKAVITEAGEALAARAVSGEVTIQFSHAGTSSYAYSEGTNLKKLTELQDVKQTVIPSNVQIANDTLISIRTMFDNSEITQEYLIQNVGIYASDGETEILFAVCQATTPDQMPAFNGVAPSSFIYNVQISIAQADQLSISINTAGVATVQDVLDLEKKMEEKKMDSSGGDASDTVASVEEPNSEEEKYPDIGSKGSMKNILGNLYRWVKTLKADKVDSAGGDTAETVISAFEASSENFPVPAVKEKAKTRWGKVKKFCEDFKAWMTGVCLLGHIVNNCVTNNPNLPLSAAQGKALMDLYTVLNTNSSKNGHIHDERYYTEAEVNNKFTCEYFLDTIIRSENMTNSLTSTIIRSAGICSITITCTIKNAVIDYNYCTIGWLPQGFYPANRVYSFGVIQGSSKAVIVDIKQDGTINVWGFGSNEIKNGDSIAIGATYPVNNAR